MIQFTNTPLLIIEGPDCTGKTTLARYLAGAYPGSFLFHATARGKLPVAMFDYQQNILDNAEEALNSGQMVVLDRHWPSEFVYGPIFRPEMPPVDATQSLNRISDMRGVYIMCDREDVVERHAAEQDPDHPYDNDNFTKVVEVYRQMTKRLENLGLPVVRYDINTWGQNKLDFIRLLVTRHAALFK